MRKVFVSRPIPEAGIRRLEEAGLAVAVQPNDRLATPQELLDGTRECDALVSMLDDRIDEAFLAQRSNLRIVAQFAVGHNNIDVAAATRRGIIVTNTPDVLTDATADMAWALMLAASRRVLEGDRFVRSGEWRGWGPVQLLGRQITGKTLGIVGFGRIGQAVARRARGFDMRVLYHNRTRKHEEEQAVGAEYRPLDELLAESDFVSINCPLTLETHHLIGRDQLARMKRSAVLVNTARGPIVDEEALVEALRDGTIAAAGLDVYEREPQVHPGLIELPNVVLAPHLGSATHETRDAMACLCAANIIAWSRNQRPPTILNPEVLGREA